MADGDGARTPAGARGQRRSAAPKRGYHHGNLRAKLIEATRSLVETHGPDGFSVAQAARAAKVSSAAPYRHFADRDALLRAVALNTMERLEDAMREAAIATASDPLDPVVAIGRAYCDFALTEPGLFRLMFGLTRDHADDETIVEQGQATLGVLIDAVQAAIGEDAERVRMRSLELWSFVHGLSFLTIDEKVGTAGIELNRDLMLRDMAERLLGASPDHPPSTTPE